MNYMKKSKLIWKNPDISGNLEILARTCLGKREHNPNEYKLMLTHLHKGNDQKPVWSRGNIL